MKKKLFVSFVLFLIICLSIYVLFVEFIQHKNPLNSVNSYRIYYRKINEEILQDMCNKDLVIVEGSFFENSDVSYLKENNTKVIGYLSLMSIGSWDSILIDKLSSSDYLTVDGEKVQSKSSENFIGAIYEESYQSALLEVLDERIMSKEMDGVFFDTVDWIDYYKDDLELYSKLKQGYSEFITKVEEKYPSITIVQNRGFNVYKDLSYAFIDGILWENFSSPYIDGDSSKIDRLEEFIKVSKKNNTKVFTISFDDEMESQKLSEELDFTHLQTEMENRYSKWDFSN
ncbi:endo alpha-1,4 polygalactosaminidase [Clostridium sp. DL1XJH146]